jgi:hypothetical protein
MGTEGAVAEPVAGAAPAAGAVNADWRPFVNDELKADPVVTSWAEKASEKDIPSLVKGYAHLSKRMGSAINLPGKEAKPEEVAALRTRLYEAGVFEAPPADVKGYGLIKPESLPEGLQWSDELAGKFATALHKHGVPKSALADLMPLYLEALGGSTKTMQIDRERAMADIKAEHGEKFAEREEMMKRMLPGILTDESRQFLDQTGLGNDPRLISMIMKLAPLAMQDSSFIESIPVQGGEITAEDARAEYARILSDPTHPQYEGFKRQDKKALEYVNNLYSRAYGNAKVKIGEGVSA